MIKKTFPILSKTLKVEEKIRVMIITYRVSWLCATENETLCSEIAIRWRRATACSIDFLLNMSMSWSLSHHWNLEKKIAKNRANIINNSINNSINKFCCQSLLKGKR